MGAQWTLFAGAWAIALTVVVLLSGCVDVGQALPPDTGIPHAPAPAPPTYPTQGVSPEVQELAAANAGSGITRAAQTLINLDRTIGQQTSLDGNAFKSSLKHAFCSVNNVLNQNQNAVILDSIAFTPGSVKLTGSPTLMRKKVVTRFYEGDTQTFDLTWLNDFVTKTAGALSKAKSIAIVIGLDGVRFFRAHIDDNDELIKALDQLKPRLVRRTPFAFLAPVLTGLRAFGGKIASKLGVGAASKGTSAAAGGGTAAVAAGGTSTAAATVATGAATRVMPGAGAGAAAGGAVATASKGPILIAETLLAVAGGYAGRVWYDRSTKNAQLTEDASAFVLGLEYCEDSKPRYSPPSQPPVASYPGQPLPYPYQTPYNMGGSSFPTDPKQSWAPSGMPHYPYPGYYLPMGTMAN
ncbi:hypothetical protein H4R35_000383 [Dimargaris xerosporica]|nr:hypothetical protein H4R35_000383 [Dimargaris xerosporica]